MQRIKVTNEDCYIQDFIDAMSSIRQNLDRDNSSDIEYELNVVHNFFLRYGQLHYNEELGYIVSGDFRKKLVWSEADREDIIKTYELTYPYNSEEKIDLNKGCFHFTPDIVIHESDNMDHIEDSYQHLIAEVKTSKNLQAKSFFWDLFKLNVYIKKLNFRNAIYYICGSDEAYIDKLVGSYIDNDYYSAHLEKITFVLQKDFNSPVSVYKYQHRDDKQD